jgi:hypothetical protein
MFWKSGGETPEEGVRTRGDRIGPIEIERHAPRPAAILKIASELEESGGEIQELFKEIRCTWGRAVLPIYMREGGEDLFVEVETAPWDQRAVGEAIDKAAVLRSSEYAGAELEILSAYPVPKAVEFFFGRSPAALLQLALFRLNIDDPEGSAALFRDVASTHWGVDLDYETGYLPLVEELLMAALNEEEDPPILDALVGGLGSFVGETIRRSTDPAGSWHAGEDWGEGPVIEVEGFVLDPIGKSRAFLHEGHDDSIAFYADYVLEQLKGADAGEKTPE